MARTVAAEGLVALNRRARFDYEIIETVEAGIVLTGTEVKSMRTVKRVSIAEAYARPEGGHICLLNATIAPYPPSGQFNHDPKRMRVLLLHRREAARISGKVRLDGVTLVPLRMYFNRRGLAKILLGLAKGRKQRDKRDIDKKRDWQRRKAAILRRNG